VVCAIHSGWRGALAGVIESALSALKKLGCQDIRAALGPSVQQASFRVQEDVLPSLPAEYLKFEDGGAFFDLPGFVLDKLKIAGVSEITGSNIDTVSDPEYFSYRRQNRKCGIQFSGIVLQGVVL
jgi:copper oxidase (laccase) domain-containing protein